MKTNEKLIEESYLVDVEGSQFNIEQEPALEMERSKTPFSQIGIGKFRKLFRRHDHVYSR